MTPIDLLPIDFPITSDPSIKDPNYFYDNVVKHLIKDVIKRITKRAEKIRYQAKTESVLLLLDSIH